MTDQNDQNSNDEIDFDDLEVPSLPMPSGSTNSALKADEDEGEDEDLRETGVHENEVDALLIETAKPGDGLDDLNDSDLFTIQVIKQLEASVARGEILLKDSELPMDERISKIRETMTELEKHLLIDAIANNTERCVAAKAMLTALASRLDHSLLRQMTKNAAPSSLPVKLQEFSEGEVDALASQLAAFTAVTDEGKREAVRVHAIVAADKARRAATGPTIAVSITPPPPPPVEERQPLIVPPASATPEIETAWQSGPEATRPANEAVTQDAPLETAAPAAVETASPAPSEESSVRVSPSLENEMVKNEEPSIPVVIAEPVQVRTRMRVGRALDNDWVIGNPSVSAHHAVLTNNEGSLQIDDLGSTHGTFVLDELANWVRIAQGSPAVVKIGQRFRFANIEAVSLHDESKRTNVHFVKPDGKFSHSIGFFWAGEQQSELHRLEQERLNAEDAAKHPQPPKVEEPRPVLRSPTEMQQSIAKSGSPGNGLSRALGVGVLILGALALLAVLFMWGSGGFNRHHTVATTETETSTEPETETVSETIAETETTAEAETPTPTDTVTTETGYSCRPGRDVASCEHVTSFLLARADGEAYWDCSGITPDQYRDLYRIEDPMGARHVIANTCACQRCEPTVH